MMVTIIGRLTISYNNLLIKKTKETPQSISILSWSIDDVCDDISWLMSRRKHNTRVIQTCKYRKKERKQNQIICVHLLLKKYWNRNEEKKKSWSTVNWLRLSRIRLCRVTQSHPQLRKLWDRQQNKWTKQAWNIRCVSKEYVEFFFPLFLSFFFSPFNNLILFSLIMQLNNDRLGL